MRITVISDFYTPKKVQYLANFKSKVTHMMVLAMRVPFVAQREPWVHAVQMAASFVEHQIMKNLAWFRRINIIDAMHNVKKKHTFTYMALD